MDTESAATLRELAGSEAGLPPQLHGRIAGEDIKTMRSDAKKLATDLGLREAPKRAENGQFVGGEMSQMIREAAGRG